MAKLKKDLPNFEVYVELTPEERKELAKHIVYVDADEAPTVPIELRSSGENDAHFFTEIEHNRAAISASRNLARNSNVCN